MKENKSRVYENTSMEAGIYANICNKQEGKRTLLDILVGFRFSSF